MCVRSSIHSVRFGKLLRCAHKRIVNIMKVYIEKKNMQVELIRFRNKYHLRPRLILRGEEFNATRAFTLGRRYDISLFDSNRFNYPLCYCVITSCRLLCSNTSGELHEYANVERNDHQFVTSQLAKCRDHVMRQRENVSKRSRSPNTHMCRKCKMAA